MGRFDFHDSPFGESTNIKLQLFRDYLLEWLPVFLSPSKLRYSQINLFDFFSGPGKGKKGSPLIILDTLKQYEHFLLDKNIKVSVYLNDKKKDKINLLKTQITSTNKNINLHFSCKRFQDAFNTFYKVMKSPSSANLLFLDQTGIKHINKEIFLQLINLNTTDFLFFISSSTINRFAELPEIKRHLPINREEVDQTNYYKIHRLVTKYYEDLIPEDIEFYLAPFSLKKGSNIYGLIFGSGHLLGLYKFLGRAWKIDKQRGEANYDIDRDSINPSKPFLFEEFNRPSKLTIFEKDLEEKIITKELKNNLDIVKFSITSGFLPKNAKKAIKKMERKKAIPQQKLRISYDAYKRNSLDNIELEKE